MKLGGRLGGPDEPRRGQRGDRGDGDRHGVEELARRPEREPERRR